MFGDFELAGDVGLAVLDANSICAGLRDRQIRGEEELIRRSGVTGQDCHRANSQCHSTIQNRRIAPLDQHAEIARLPCSDRIWIGEKLIVSPCIGARRISLPPSAKDKAGKRSRSKARVQDIIMPRICIGWKTIHTPIAYSAQATANHGAAPFVCLPIRQHKYKAPSNPASSRSSSDRLVAQYRPSS